MEWLALESGLSADRVEAALSVLASSGRVGWDVLEQSFFHRELPDREGMVEKRNPRLTAARRLFDEGAIRRDLSIHSGRGSDAEVSRWMVRSGDADYTVTLQVPVSAGDTHRAEADLAQGNLTRGTHCTCT